MPSRIFYGLFRLTALILLYSIGPHICIFKEQALEKNFFSKALRKYYYFRFRLENPRKLSKTTFLENPKFSTSLNILHSIKINLVN